MYRATSFVCEHNWPCRFALPLLATEVGRALLSRQDLDAPLFQPGLDTLLSFHFAGRMAAYFSQMAASPDKTGALLARARGSLRLAVRTGNAASQTSTSD